MYSIINRISWLFAITTFVAIFSIDDDFFIFAVIAAIIIKVFLNKWYIENWINSLKNEIESEILSKISNIWLNKKDLNKIKDTISTNDEKVVNNESKATLLDRLNEKEDINALNKDNIDSFESKFEEEYIEPQKIDEEVNEPIQEVPSEPSKIWLFLKEFFAENVMAKIGWILLALGVIFLMSLVYSLVWPVAKILIWFVLWFGIYITWIIVGSKGYENESMILLWTWILINYIVILSWKFIIWEPWVNWYLTSSVTFSLLILNTIFSVVTAFIYKSKNLLLFSIIFAYVIPFLTGSSYESFELVGYSLILSLWWFAISSYFHNNDDNISSLQMIFICLIWWNILLLLASLNNSTDFAIKMTWYNIINFLSIFLLYRNDFVKNILINFIISYIFLALLMFSWATLTWLSILISFIIAVLGLLIINSFFLITSVWAWLIYIIFLPIFFILGFIFIGPAWSWIILLPLFLITYLLVFAFWVWSVLATWLKYLFFIVIWFFLFIGNTYVLNNLWIDSTTFNTIALTSFIFLLATYILSSKKDLHYLYTVWTVSVIVLLLEILQIRWDFYQLSIICLVIFWLSNYLLPFINKNLVKNDSQNLVLWSVFWIIFMWLYLYRYGNAYFPGVTMWLWFLALAVLYFIGGFILYGSFEKKDSEVKESDLNFIYTFLWIAISLFSISVALVFAQMPAIVAMVWLFQSSLVFFFANKLWQQKIYAAGIILFMVWLAKYWHYFSYLVFDLLLDISQSSMKSIVNNWWFNIANYASHLIWNIFIWISIFLNIIIFRKTEFKSTIWVNLLHVVWVIILWLNIVYLFTDYILKYLVYWNNTWIPMVVIWVLILVLSIIYNLIWNKFTKWFLLLFTYIVLFIHIFIAWETDNFSLNHLFTIIIWVVYFIDKFAIDSWKIEKFWGLFKVFSFVFSLYSFIITSVYLYDATHNYFSLTIYWWILSLLFVYFWLNKDLKAFRTIWLYILILTLIKIIFYDINNWIDNWIIRVIAFMFVGWIMIYISSIYKSMWFKMKDDLNFTFNEKIWYDSEVLENSTNNTTTNSNEQKTNVNIDLDKIDLWDKKSITFIFNDWKKVKIRAKDLIKMWIIVTKRAWKNNFVKWELKTIFDYIKNNYKSELSKKDYDKIIEIIESFIEVWGSVEIE